HRLRDAVENGWPRGLDLREHSHAEMAASYAAGAANLPFGVLRGARGTDLPAHNDATRALSCPFTGEELCAVEALRPDVAVIHAQQADREGNVRMWGIVGVQKEAVLAAKRSIITVEEVVDAFEPGAAGTVLPGWAVSAVCEVPGGARPSYAQGYYARDNGFYERWDAIARERETFRAWMDEHVMGTKDFAEYSSALEKVAAHG
ncbi:MAG: CoA-transferase, partial [Alphaproteobacteria bacterium]